MCVANGWVQTWCKPKLLPSPSVFQLCTPKQACLISRYCNISGNYEAGLLSSPFRPRACVFKAERLHFTLLGPDSTRGEAVARLATVITPVLGNCYIREPTGDNMWRRNGRCKPCIAEEGWQGCCWMMDSLLIFMGLLNDKKAKMCQFLEKGISSYTSGCKKHCFLKHMHTETEGRRCCMAD